MEWFKTNLWSYYNIWLHCICSCKSGKIKPGAKQGVFLVYPHSVKGYRVWIIEDKKCVISRDVVFDESMFYKTNLEGDKILTNSSSKKVEKQSAQV